MDFEIDDYNALHDALQKLCRALVAERVPDDAVFSSKLVASELVSNVLQHGGGHARFAVVREGDMIRMCVKSACSFCPPEKSVCSKVDSESGRGLFLVDEYCETRTYSEREGICVVIKIKR